MIAEQTQNCNEHKVKLWSLYNKLLHPTPSSHSIPRMRKTLSRPDGISRQCGRNLITKTGNPIRRFMHNEACGGRGRGRSALQKSANGTLIGLLYTNENITDRPYTITSDYVMIRVSIDFVRRITITPQGGQVDG